MSNDKAKDTTIENNDEISQLSEEEKQKIAQAQCDMGFCYCRGENVKKNYKKAVECWRKSAELGNAIAQYFLGFSYETGEGVRKNQKKAFEWYRKAAEQNMPNALGFLGYCYEGGIGVKKNMTKAMEYYHKAAALGNTSIQNYLAEIED